MQHLCNMYRTLIAWGILFSTNCLAQVTLNLPVQDTLVSLLDSTTPKKGLIPYIKDKYQKITTADRMIIPFPIITRQPETGWVAGVAIDYYFKPKDSAIAAVTRPSYVYASVTYSQLRQLQTELTWQAFTPFNKYFLRGQISFVNNYDRFWGIGNETPETNLSEYNFNRTRVQLKGLRQLGNGLFVGAYAQADWYSTVNWFNLDPEIDLKTVPGSDDNRIIGIGPAFLYDTRDNPYAPYKGWYAELQTTFFAPMFGSEYSFERILIDARKYVPLGGRPNHLVAFQSILNFSIGPTVPFREMGRLGSPTIMRGYFNGRFKDRHMAEAQAEYRFPIWNIISGAAFYSFGRVAKDPADLARGKFHYSYGFGPRITVNKKQRVSLRLDIAFNEFGRSEFYARFFEAF